MGEVQNFCLKSCYRTINNNFYKYDSKNCPKKYNIDYFGYAVNLEFKFKLNFDQERGSKIEKKVKIPKKDRVKFSLILH